MRFLEANSAAQLSSAQFFLAHRALHIAQGPSFGSTARVARRARVHRRAPASGQLLVEYARVVQSKMELMSRDGAESGGEAVSAGWYRMIPPLTPQNGFVWFCSQLVGLIMVGLMMFNATFCVFFFAYVHIFILTFPRG